SPLTRSQHIASGISFQAMIPSAAQVYHIINCWEIGCGRAFWLTTSSIAPLATNEGVRYKVDPEVIGEGALVRAGEHDDITVLTRLQAAQLTCHAKRLCAAKRRGAQRLLKRHAHRADS